MNKNLYGLMNWPEIEGIVYAECDKPKELLGAHVTGKGLLIQIMRPDAVAVKLHIDGRKTAVNMEKVDESGFINLFHINSSFSAIYMQLNCHCIRTHYLYKQSLTGNMCPKQLLWLVTLCIYNPLYLRPVHQTV